LLYTSARYQPNEPKWRILLPTSELLFPDADADNRTENLKQIRAKLVARVAGLFGNIFYQGCFELSRSFYYGGVGDNPNHRAEIISGDYIDLRPDLDAGALGKGEKPKANTKAISCLKPLRACNRRTALMGTSPH
jgi:hypothetical protein